MAYRGRAPGQPLRLDTGVPAHLSAASLHGQHRTTSRVVANQASPQRFLRCGGVRIQRAEGLVAKRKPWMTGGSCRLVRYQMMAW